MANILVLGVKIPFTKGGAETLVNTLVKELKARGHDADTVELPLSFNSKEASLGQSALWRTVDLSSFGGKNVDLVIATKFPSYYAKFPKKSVWLVHQYRESYDLYGTRFSDFSDDPRDEALRRMLTDADRKVLSECSYISGISKNVVDRLNKYNDLSGEVLYPPLPLGNKYQSGNFSDYILSVGRICTIKRVDMAIKALPIVHNFIKLKVVGTPDEGGVMEYFKNEIDKHHLWDRVEFLGRVSDEELINLYANSLAVYYAPFDEDYGYVTLEAFASKKPVITAQDSGGVLEFVKHEVNGLVVEPTIDAVGHGINKLVEDRELAKRLGLQGYKFIESSGLMTHGWEHVISRLISPLNLS
ncbi:MAG: glycosyltransferase family 4 protein [bacterium]|nr:glycosyltransferase family 4 protein [bacterium]